MMKKNKTFLFLGFMLFALSTVYAQNDVQRKTELVIIVHASAKIDSISDVELSRILRGQDRRFKVIGLHKKHYRTIIEGVAKTKTGNFERTWLGLISTGKRIKKPIISNAVKLIGLVAKKRVHLAIIDWQGIGKSPETPGIKTLKLYSKKGKKRLQIILQ